MRASNILNLGVKELRGLWRDRGLLILIVYAFTFAVYAGSRAVPETLNNAPIAIVDEDRSPLSERIIAAFQPPYFSPPQTITAAEMDRRMDAGLDVVWPQFLALFGIGSILFVLALRRFRAMLK